MNETANITTENALEVIAAEIANKPITLTGLRLPACHKTREDIADILNAKYCVYVNRTGTGNGRYGSHVDSIEITRAR